MLDLQERTSLKLSVRSVDVVLYSVLLSQQLSALPHGNEQFNVQKFLTAPAVERFHAWILHW